MFRTTSFILSYIVSHLRERALRNDWRYILATIYDGQNNIKEKKTPIFGVEKGKAQKIDHPIPYHHQQNLLGILTMSSIFVVISEVDNKKITKNLEETGKSPIFAKANDY